MDKNVLSPDQLKTLQVFQYDQIHEVIDASLNNANRNLENVLSNLSEKNSILQKNATSLQTILDAVILPKEEGNDELIEHIRWNRYFYKKYTYQTHVMVVLLFMCIVINVLHNAVSPNVFIAATGFILSVAFVYLGYIMWDLMYRDNINFDEYNFYNYIGQQVHQNLHNSEIDPSNCVVRKIEEYYDTP
jgi:hypothetical protein